MKPDCAFDVPHHVIARQLGGETVILDLEHGTYFALDPLGTRIFELAREGRPFADIHRAVLEEYDVDAAVLTADMEALFRDLEEHGLVIAK